jgi:hypothetical protein
MQITEFCITIARYLSWELFRSSRHQSDADEHTSGRIGVRIELEFNRFDGLMRGGLPFPLTDGIFCRLHQHRISTFNHDGFDGAVGSNQSVYFLASLQIHDPSHFRIVGHDPVHHLAGWSFFFLGRRRHVGEDDCQKHDPERR